MDNKNNESEFMGCYEYEYESIKDENLDCDYECDFDEADEYFTNELENIRKEGYEKGYKNGYKDGYEKAKQEILDYMKKNKCCIKCEHNRKSEDTHKNKCSHKMK